MPLPLVYTEGTLRVYMEDVLDETGVSLGLGQSAVLDRAAEEVVLLVGALADQTTTDELRVVRAAARWQALLAARRVAAGRHDLKSGDDDLKQSQVFGQLGALITEAEGAYYAAVAAGQAAGGDGVAFYFGVACGGRGR